MMKSSEIELLNSFPTVPHPPLLAFLVVEDVHEHPVVVTYTTSRETPFDDALRVRCRLCLS